MELDIIYNEDCLKGLKELPDHSIDLIVTDPPYLISATNGGGTVNKVKKLNESLKDLTTVDITKGYDIELFNVELVRVMKEINIYLWCNNLYFNTFINELVNLFQQKDEYDFLLLYAKTLNTNVIKQCILQRADLLITHMHFDEDVYEFAKLKDIRIIFVGSRLNNTEIDNVSIDNFAGCVLAARHLESIKDGNDKYLYVGIDYFLSAHRYSIFKTELKQTNKDALIAKFNSERESISVLYSYVKEGYRKIFFYNDMLGYEIFDQLEKYAPDFRKDFPDLRIVGFDGLSTYVCGLEDIDSIEIDFSKFAKSTYDIMKNRIEQPKSETQNVVLPVSLHLKK